MYEHDEKQFTELSQPQPSEQTAGQEPVGEAAGELNHDGPAVREQAKPAAPGAERAGDRSEVNGSAEAPSWRAEAGRKGARRIHQLIEHGKLYEQEHGLKSGRQRLRQLIEEGRLYEKEHGLGQESRRRRGARPKRLSNEQQLLHFLQSVLRLAKPRFRSQVARLIQLLESEKN
jgi:hypothetical protein